MGWNTKHRNFCIHRNLVRCHIEALRGSRSMNSMQEIYSLIRAERCARTNSVADAMKLDMHADDSMIFNNAHENTMQQNQPRNIQGGKSFALILVLVRLPSEKNGTEQHYPRFGRRWFQMNSVFFARLQNRHHYALICSGMSPEKMCNNFHKHW